MADMRHQPHQKRPECVDCDRDRRRVDEGAEKDDDRRAVEEVAYADVGVDAGRKRQHGERDLRSQFEGFNPFAQRPRHDGLPSAAFPASRAPSRAAYWRFARLNAIQPVIPSILAGNNSAAAGGLAPRAREKKL
jgi:hypothetical protein